uniref:Membrane magnesium transporter n=1 Tax=Fibrocapsa japonica TaxID=94617 RepID=A0A7S2V2I7_9STRA|mmetsp:Transcript_4362/g.6522  ORF Transcript_4362/g.6522 Transcript_4362/m.6522 type:complete len:110 (+) Transcript_4362:165-494(+)|eukprot:CAMPEP_0113943582 /NCGR_PEP_ID=MMETSP1339-20121228/26601_1 /TAXON_ID=94617 /ORGANISM="Fibrocapsa japonica" /LENGTH=109 /DNA_ID=CAMNT_0000948491 /DNA_START=142 /DNA_END=471 /DNA_ORIENTATION=+ /assembly_acc=CAM_ASM_000762
MNPGTVIILIGMAILLHAGYSAAHFKSLVVSSVHGADLSNVSIPPVDVVVGCAIGFSVCLLGVLTSAAPLKPIVASHGAGQGSFDEMASSPEFNIFNHRGKALSKRLKL